VIIKLKKISLILLILIFFSDTLKSNQIFRERKDLNKNQLTSNFISEIGDVNKDTIWKSIFLDKTFDDIESFVKTIPTKSPNPFVQEMVFDFLTTKKNLNNKNISKEEDSKIFELLVNQLFETGRINEIEYYYSQSSNLKMNEFILIKIIEGNFLRNRQEEACKILAENANVSPAIFGKVIIICDIIANKYDQAKLGLLLLKEQNKPGDSFFIDLAYSLMSENSQSDSESIKKKLDQIKSLNPIIMSSLQFADISPTYEQIENLNTSGLLFVLSNPSVETDVKIFCSELLIKQGRISFDFLSEAYLLPRYKNAELENALKLYKTLSPAKARPLLYQSIIIEKNEEVKFQKIVALLKVSVIDNLFSQISSLVYKLVDLKNITISKEQIFLISKMFQVQNEFNKANEVLRLIQDEYDLDLIFRKISIELNKQLYDKSVDIDLLEEKVKKLAKVKELNSQKYQKIIMNLTFNNDLSQTTKDIINKLSFSSNEKFNSNSLHNLLLAEKYSKKQDLFNSTKFFFEILGNKSFNNLTILESYKILLILRNLGFEKELRRISIKLTQ
tara:strand:- start:452 stop:2131 length:1680 start_codon:yes stop_codon:yes gene_type:complete